MAGAHPYLYLFHCISAYRKIASLIPNRSSRNFQFISTLLQLPVEYDFLAHSNLHVPRGQSTARHDSARALDCHQVEAGRRKYLNLNSSLTALCSLIDSCSFNIRIYLSLISFIKMVRVPAHQVRWFILLYFVALQTIISNCLANTSTFE